MDVERELGLIRQELREVQDRQEIAACIHRYTRGVDRMDEELILSAFHADGVDYHGPTTLTPTEFVEWYRTHQEHRRVSQHWVSNMTMSVDGDSAHCETYYLGALRDHGDDEHVDMHGGRYIDRLERRDGVWRIAVRVSVPEWHVLGVGGRSLSYGGAPMAELLGDAYLGARDRSDLSYQRPLVGRLAGETDSSLVERST